VRKVERRMKKVERIRNDFRMYIYMILCTNRRQRDELMRQWF
jgi:hypothetical protein